MFLILSSQDLSRSGACTSEKHWFLLYFYWVEINYLEKIGCVHVCLKIWHIFWNKGLHMAGILPPVLQTCMGAARMQIGHDQTWDTHSPVVYWEQKKTCSSYNTWKKQNGSLYHGNSKDYGPIPFSAHYLWCFPAHGQQCTPHAAPPHNTALSKSPLHLSSNGQFSGWKQFPACSSLQLIPKQPCLLFPPVMSPPWSWLTQATKGNANSCILVIATCWALGVGKTTQSQA